MAIGLELTVAASPERIKQSTPGYKIIEKLPSPRLIATHIPEPLCPPQWFTKEAKDLKGTVTKIAQFLEKKLSDDVIESITQQCTMKGMKKAYNKVEEDYPETGKMMTHLFGQIPFLRKGVVGNWKEYFSPEQNEFFDKYYEEKMAGSGLTFDFEL
ncbi:Sulfotransferase family cytosolic 1B member 1 [Holothuria leucospilota]|uniref:Sulfotransferase family cytosolic 1B member 1 n=1 Tax=Holothuria leucospilota TaxID=206669 RepID=A0A9Q1BRP3_HOLLE|nr:Sulfotransferase family cytosolic 1B member 1 [Holothuria leucospilota]